MRAGELEAGGVVTMDFITVLRGLCLDLGAGRGGKVGTSEGSDAPSALSSIQSISTASREVVSDCVIVVGLLLGT